MTDAAYTAISSISAAVTAVVTLAAVVVAMRAARYASDQANSLKEQNESAKAGRLIDIHSRFQSEIREIQRSFPPEVNNNNWKPSEEDKRNIALYWYLVFDEWLTCTQLGNDLEVLWKNHYSHGVKAALRLPAFKIKIEEIFRGSSTFLGYGIDFRREIEQLCFEATGHPLKA